MELILRPLATSTAWNKLITGIPTAWNKLNTGCAFTGTLIIIIIIIIIIIPMRWPMNIVTVVDGEIFAWGNSLHSALCTARGKTVSRNVILLLYWRKSLSI